ncbi:type VII secretion protein EccB, Actinobacterial [Haloechinothrix halophila YIM 93223]|uniref:Type VII secretion protein EccB, Actinobacterial n=2 Tax=Haloechinothrix TaxID=1425377 RepID=W9DSE6_9PSEU|nr:type VII secretion protein EccB, Actinobacterial [Haloechinothrix halophila YIM 93223]
MNSALVRKDAVMLHDPLRTHTRATVVGVILAAVGLLGFMIFGILKPATQPPSDGIVMGKESGQMYVKVADPEEMLIPTFNLASARLILMSRQSQGQGGDVPADPVEPVLVSDDNLKDIPRGRLQGIPGGPPLLPNDEQRISDEWAVCHYLPLDDRFNESVRLDKAKETQQTAVLAGLPGSDLGTPLEKNEAIYVERLNGDRYLIYRPEENPNRKSDIVLAKVPDEESVIEALKLDRHTPRPMSLGLTNAIPEVDPLEPPVPEGLDEPVSFDIDGRTAVVGDVFSVTQAGGTVDYYVVLKDGKQQVTQAVANMLRHEHSTETTIPQVSPDRLDELPTVSPDDELPVDDYPDQIPTVLDPLKGSPATCLGWTLTGSGDNQESRTTLYVNNEIPFPEDENGKPERLRVGKANEDGIAVDYFYMPPGRAAVVNSATSEASFESGPIQLVSDRGLRYGIPDTETAAFLGLAERRPAPESILRLLPTGESLNVQAAARTFDSVDLPVNSGDYDGQTAGADEATG